MQPLYVLVCMSVFIHFLFYSPSTFINNDIFCLSTSHRPSIKIRQYPHWRCGPYCGLMKQVQHKNRLPCTKQYFRLDNDLNTLNTVLRQLAFYYCSNNVPPIKKKEMDREREKTHYQNYFASLIMVLDCARYFP